MFYSSGNHSGLVGIHGSGQPKLAEIPGVQGTIKSLLASPTCRALIKRIGDHCARQDYMGQQRNIFSNQLALFDKILAFSIRHSAPSLLTSRRRPCISGSFARLRLLDHSNGPQFQHYDQCRAQVSAYCPDQPRSVGRTRWP